MYKKPLSISQQENLKSEILSGVDRVAIARNFKVSRSSVYHYMRKLKQDGIVVKPHPKAPLNNKSMFKKGALMKDYKYYLRIEKERVSKNK